MIEFKTPYTFDKVVRLLIGITILVLIFLLFRRLSAVLTPFFVGWLLAYMLHPIVCFFQYKLKFRSRILSISTTLVLFFSTITGIIILLIPLVSKEINNFSLLIQNYTENLSVDSFLPVAWQNAIMEYFSGFNLTEMVNNPNIMELFRKVAPQLWGIFNTSLSFILSLMVVMIVLLYLIFILKDYEKITESFPRIIPQKYRPVVTGIFSDIEDGMNRYFRGQALIALISGVLFVIGFLIIDLPMAIIFGLFIGLLTLVPYLKAVAIVPGMFLFILKASEPGHTFGGVLLSVLIIFTVIQIFEDLILVPKIMGKVTGLQPAVILLSLSVWGALMGVIGMIIALPLTTLIISYYKRWVIGTEEQTVISEEIITKSEEVITKSE